jgi:transposase
MSIVAMDLGKSKSVVCVYEAGSGAHRFEMIATTPAEVRRVIQAERPSRVVIEIGSSAGWVCDLCRELGVQVLVANTNGEAWKWRTVKRKSDRDDALKLARLTALGELPTVHVPAPAVRAWRELIAYRQSLVARRTAIKNSIRAILTRRAIAWPPGPAGWTAECLTQLRAMSLDGAEAWRVMLGAELDQLEMVASQVAGMEKELDAMGATDGRTALLRTIPGVGPRLAETIVAVIDDPHRFTSGKQVGCYAGLTPRRHQSGSTDRQGRISGAGHELLRSLLVEVAWLGRRWNPWMKEVYERALRGSVSRKKIAIVAVARRLLVVCWAMLRDNTPWREGLSSRLTLAA